MTVTVTGTDVANPKLGVDVNPCGYPNPACYYRVTPVGGEFYDVVTCGWYVTTNTCYTTPWCEPSVPSVGENGDPARP